MTDIEVADRHRLIVERILHRRLTPLNQPVTVLAFGSRVTGKVRRMSDLDLALDSAQELPFLLTEALREDFEGSLLPYEVDVLDLRRAQDYVRDNVLRQAVIFWQTPTPIPALFNESISKEDG